MKNLSKVEKIAKFMGMEKYLGTSEEWLIDEVFENAFGDTDTMFFVMNGGERTEPLDKTDDDWDDIPF